MRPTELVCYETEHVLSRIVCRSFAKGANAKVLPAARLQDGPAMVYGILRGCGEILKQCEWIGRDYWHVDLGYMKRSDHEKGDMAGYYRVSRNGLQDEVLKDVSPQRFEALNIPIRPWRRTGKHILVIPISGGTSWFHNVKPHAWLEAVVNETSKWTERPIIVKPKHQGNLAELMRDAWCVVTHSSNVAIDSLVAGVPVLALGPSAAKPVSWTFADIEKPWWPEREPLFWSLAHKQVTLDEMSSGKMWEVMQ